uniref:Uncharacterized protein n=1 Tax=Lotus japonicus TaxID=34305 RepID=I3SPX3_LOTJA|nr:unknown [Lotus japonicus]
MLEAVLLFHKWGEIQFLHHPSQMDLLLQLLKPACATSIIHLKVANLVIDATLPMGSGNLAGPHSRHMKILVVSVKCKE